MTQQKSQKASPKRQQTNTCWRVLGKMHERGLFLRPHTHPTGQLIYAISGVMQIETASGQWTIPPQRALWIPPQCEHAVRMLSDTAMRTIYFERDFIAQCKEIANWHEVQVTVASPLLKELVLGLFDLENSEDAHLLMALLLLQTLCKEKSLATNLPMPKDERLRQAVTHLIATNGWHLSMLDVASLAAMSERSFTRHFSADVGMSFRMWKQRARVIASLDLLATDRSVKYISNELGFLSSAAYIAAFREQLNCTPKAFRAAG
jgi:AraC-like DNA-binding protein